MSGIVTLLTDFGLQDEYAGVVKGVLMRFNPQVQSVDLCHAIPRGYVRGAAFMLVSSWGFFPKGSVHVAVVDPGVGSKRALLGASFRGHFFLAPDNGILSHFLNQSDLELVRLRYKEPKYATFHGRDVLAPIAAQLAAGRKLAEFGDPVPAATATVLDNLYPIKDGQRRLTGFLVWSDRFGNIMTNIRQDDLLSAKDNQPHAPVIKFRGVRYPLKRYFAEVKPGQKLAFINSRGYLELAVNNGSLAASLDLVPPFEGETVVVYK